MSDLLQTDVLAKVRHCANLGLVRETDFIGSTSLDLIATAPHWKGKQAPTSLEVWPVCDGHEGLENHAGLGNVTHGLVARGYSEEDIHKLMGGNWLRLLGDTMG